MALPACEAGGGPAEVALDPESFVEAFVALRVAEREAASQAEFEARRDSILEEYGTSREEMLRFVDAHAENPAVLAETWDSVRTRLERDTTPAQ